MDDAKLCTWSMSTNGDSRPGETFQSIGSILFKYKKYRIGEPEDKP